MPLSQAQLGPVNPVLSQYAQHLRPGKYIADVLFPQLPIIGEKGQIPIWDQTNLEVPTDAKRAIGAVSSQGFTPEPSYVDYQTVTYARHDYMTQREANIADAQGMGSEMIKRAKVAKLVDQILLVRERDLASKLNTSANYESGFSTSLGTTWAAAGGTPISDIETAIKKLLSVGISPNVIAMDHEVWVTLQRHSEMVDLTKQVKRGMIDASDFYAIFGLNVVVAKGVYKSNSTTFARTWEDSAIVCYVDGFGGDITPDMGVTFGRTLVSSPFSVIEIDAPDHDHRGATKIEVEMAFAHQFMAIDNTTDKDSIAGYLIDNAV